MREIISSRCDFMDKMMDNKWLGNKTKQGFYKKTKDEKGKNVKLVLDYNTMEYVPAHEAEIRLHLRSQKEGR